MPQATFTDPCVIDVSAAAPGANVNMVLVHLCLRFEGPFCRRMPFYVTPSKLPQELAQLSGFLPRSISHASAMRWSSKVFRTTRHRPKGTRTSTTSRRRQAVDDFQESVRSCQRRRRFIDELRNSNESNRSASTVEVPFDAFAEAFQ